jgi:hypothetical protein
MDAVAPSSSALARASAELSMAITCSNARVFFFSTFSYVCPEPVLVKNIVVSIIPHRGAERDADDHRCIWCIHSIDGNDNQRCFESFLLFLSHLYVKMTASHHEKGGCC